MDPTQPPATGTGNYLISAAVVDIGVIAFTSKPVTSLIELVFDSISSPTDHVDVHPARGVASSVAADDSVQLSYPTGLNSSTSPSDQPKMGLSKKVADTSSAQDNFSYTLTQGGGPAEVWVGNANWSLTNNDTTATAVVGDHTIYGSVDHLADADHTFSITINEWTTAITVGVADQANNGDNVIGSNVYGCSIDAAGDVIYQGYNIGGNVGGDMHSITVITIRFKGGYVYFSGDGGATWVGTTNGADPVAGTGGVGTAGWTSCYAAAWVDQAGNQVTASF